MLAESITLTNGTNNTVFTKRREGNFSSEYRGVTDITGEICILTVNHTLPGRGQPNESHLVKVVIQHLDANGDYSHSTQGHVVLKTLDNIQDADDSNEAAQMLHAFLANGTYRDKIIAGES